ncbi:hypothetical protein Clacol_007675 [Clathrus columnatus]|uniref:VASt domain-containing protein n=1 Tax=Clathrus columnatus TaxID=1419009 RepID=A0AAV5AKE7_9AGAM|nr:hypothetical protein Clacol_007675 [Clathrus columnatus]
MPSLLSKFTKTTSSAAQPELDRNPAQRRIRVSSEHSPLPPLNESLPLPPTTSSISTQSSFLPVESLERRTPSPRPQNQAQDQSQNWNADHSTSSTLNNANSSAGSEEITGIPNPNSSTLLSTQTRIPPSSIASVGPVVSDHSMSSEKRRQSASEPSYVFQKPFVGSPPQDDSLLSNESSLAPASMSAGAGITAATGTKMSLPSTSSSPSSPPQKKSSWRRRESSGSSRSKQNSQSQRRIHPSGGLASAIAGTGLTLANTAMQRPINIVPPAPTTNNSSIYRTESITSNGKDRHAQSRRSSASTSVNGSQDPSTPYRSMTFDSISTYKEDGSSSSPSDEEEDETSQDELDPLSNGVAPITGFAVASNKRTADFHALFPTVPEGDYLIDDYGCALQREILIQGRLYISENHLCFHANIFGWTTDLVIPVEDIIQIEKKMTAYVIPNAIQVSTYNAKHTFASLLNRDTTYDVLYNIWRSVRPEGAGIGSSPRGSLDINRTGTNSMGSVMEGMDISGGNSAISPDGTHPTSSVHTENKTSHCACGKEGRHFPESAMDTIVPGEPEKIYNLMFASGFIKDFMRNEERLMDIQISDWTPKATGSHLLQRNMSYIKPLNGSIGPKQTKCELTDEMVHLDYNDYISMLTTTRTPDVPSGGVFAVKTQTCLMWASRASTRILVTTTVEWTGRSFIKGIIERSCIDGQKAYHNSLERSMRRYISENKAEFFPSGIDADSALDDALASGESASSSPVPPAPELSSEDIRKAKEKERSQRGLQWALDTAEGTAKVAHQSFWGAIELIKDTWESSSTTAVLWFVVVGLLLSNVWTYFRAGRNADKYARRYKDPSYPPYPYPPYSPLREDDVQRVVGESVRDALRIIEDAVRGGPVGNGDPKSSNLGDAIGVAEEISDMKIKIESLEKKITVLEMEIANTATQVTSLEALD